MAEYIEREAVMLQINIADFVRDDNYEAGATLLFQDDVVDRISSIPAADVRPVVRAEWQSCEQDKPPCKWYSCDYCGFHALNKSNFCPNCGAKMQNSLEKVEANSKKSLEKVEGC